MVELIIRICHMCGLFILDFSNIQCCKLWRFIRSCETRKIFTSWNTSSSYWHFDGRVSYNLFKIMSFMPCINPAVSEQFDISLTLRSFIILILAKSPSILDVFFFFLHLSIGMCSLVGAYLRFRRTYCLHHQGTLLSDHTVPTWWPRYGSLLPWKIQILHNLRWFLDCYWETTWHHNRLWQRRHLLLPWWYQHLGMLLKQWIIWRNQFWTWCWIDILHLDFSGSLIGMNNW